MQRMRQNEGFTLLEIMVVVLIIGLLMTVLATNVFKRLGGAQADIARLQVSKLSQQLELYKLDNGTYPTSEQGLDALVHEPTSEPRPRRYPEGGYVTGKDLIDPWQSPFKYERRAGTTPGPSTCTRSARTRRPEAKARTPRSATGKRMLRAET